MTRWALPAVVVGIGLRLLALSAHELPRGDVVLDVGVARSLVAGQGFASGYVRGVVAVPGEQPPPPQGHADQHPPLWPLLGALFTPVAGSPFAALQLLSFLAGLLLLALVVRVGERLFESHACVPEGLPLLAAALLALGFLPVDSSANGSLYGAQAVLVLALVESLARPRPGAVLPGLLLGALMLLNHQTLVLLPVPLLVCVAGVPPCQRARGLRIGLGAAALALLALVPWWWRNGLVFGDPLHTVNGLYLAFWAGAPVRFAVDDGLALQRVGELPGVVGLVRALLGFVAMNAMYLLVTGLAVVPGLAGLALVGLPCALWRGVQRCDRRRLALVLVTLALLSVSLAWPAAKLRYLVSLAPLLVLLGLDLGLDIGLGVGVRGGLARLARAAVLLAWGVATAASALDAFDDGDAARPLRFAWLAIGGALLLVAPLRSWARGVSIERGAALASGWPLVLLLGLAVPLGPVFGAGGGTAYHGTWFLPDAFGQDAEARDAERVVLLGIARRQALDEGMRRLAGPIDLLAWPEPALVELPDLAPDDLLATLDSLLGRHAVDGLVLIDPTDATRAALGTDGRFSEAAVFGNPAATVVLLRRSGP